VRGRWVSPTLQVVEKGRIEILRYAQKDRESRGRWIWNAAKCASLGLRGRSATLAPFKDGGTAGLRRKGKVAGVSSSGGS
jgi:hypothetical protein